MTELQIKYFLKVAQCMSFTQAAQELFLSQPSISRQVSLLEEELGVRLFDRQNRNRLSLTPAGMVYRDSFLHIQGVLHQAASAAGALGENAVRSLRAGIGSGWDLAGPLGDCVRAIRAKYPRAECAFQAHSFRQLQALLATGELDVILCPRDNLHYTEGMEVRRLTDLAATLYYSARGRAEGELSLSQLVQEPLYVLPQEETPLSTQLNLISLQMAGEAPEAVTLPNRDSILLALESGRGFTIFDDWMDCRRLPDIRTLPLGESIPVCAAWMQDNLNPLIRLFAEEIAQAWRWRI